MSGSDLFPGDRRAEARLDPEHLQRHAIDRGDVGVQDCQPVQSERARHAAEQAVVVGGDDRERVVAPVDEASAGTQPAELLVGREVVGELLHGSTTEDVTGATDKLGDQARLPRAPRRWTGREAVGLGQRGQQLEGAEVAHKGCHRGGRSGIVEVSTSGHIGQEQVVANQRLQGGDVGAAEAEPRTDLARRAGPRLRCDLPGSPCRGRAAEHRPRAGRAGSPWLRGRRRWPLLRRGAGRR